MTPRTHALAFRIWRYAEPKGWNVTAAEVSTALMVDINRIIATCRHKGWSGRFRKTAISTKNSTRYRPDDAPSTVAEQEIIRAVLRDGVL